MARALQADEFAFVELFLQCLSPVSPKQSSKTEHKEAGVWSTPPEVGKNEILPIPHLYTHKKLGFLLKVAQQTWSRLPLVPSLWTTPSVAQLLYAASGEVRKEEQRKDSVLCIFPSPGPLSASGAEGFIAVGHGLV